MDLWEAFPWVRLLEPGWKPWYLKLARAGPLCTAEDAEGTKPNQHFFVSWKVGTNSSEIRQTMELLTTSIKVFFCTSSICELMDFGRFRSEMCAKHQVMYCISLHWKQMAWWVSGLWGQELLFMAMSLDCVDFVESNSTNLYLMPERSWLKMKLLKLLHLSGGWFLGFTCSETFGFRRGLGWRSAYGPLDTTHARWGFPGKNGWTHFW